MSKILFPALLAITALILLSGCIPHYVNGSGNIVSEKRAVSNFSRVTLNGSGNVTILQGDTEGLKIEADDNLLDYITSEVRGDTLYLSYKNNNLGIPAPSQQVRFYVSMKEVAGLKIAGSGRIEAERLEANDLGLEIAGSGKIEIGTAEVQNLNSRVTGSGNVRVTNLEAGSMSTTISGSGKFVLSGRVQKQSVEINGAGNYLAADLQSNQAQVQIGGSGNVELDVAESLDVDIDGSGKIVYSGQPRIKQSISGSGKIQNVDAN